MAARRAGAWGWACCCWVRCSTRRSWRRSIPGTSSTAYNHCFLVIPIALYLLWDRRFDLVGIAPRPTPAVLLLGLPLALIWLVAERLGIMEGRQLVGTQLCRAAVPGGAGQAAVVGHGRAAAVSVFPCAVREFLTPRLQDITTWFIRHGLDILGVPAYIDGYIIEIPQGTFFVAQACAGLRFLIASIAFGCLYALMMYRSPVRRGVFILVSIIVPIIANGFRGLGIVYLGYLLDSAQAAAADHIIYGWIFFSFVILVLIALGLPFRQDHISTRSAAPADEAGGAAAVDARDAGRRAGDGRYRGDQPDRGGGTDDGGGDRGAGRRRRSTWGRIARCGRWARPRPAAVSGRSVWCAAAWRWT